MEHSIGLRMYVAARIVAGFVVASGGSALLGFGLEQGGQNLIIGFLAWLVALFIGLVIALEGLIALLEGTLEAVEGTGERS